MGKLAEDDQEGDEARHPAPELVRVDDLVAEQCHDQGRRRDDDNARVAWNIVVHRIQQLCADDDIDGRPADARKDVEDRN